MKFCVITPTYNRAHTIERAVKSIQSQTYDNWEMIISDDGSTDNTKNVLEPYLSNDSRIKYIGQNINKGVCKARNNGFNSISNDVDWVCFLDSDDVYLVDSLSLMKEKIKSFPDIKHFAFSTKYENGKNACKIIHDNFIGDYKTVLGENDFVDGEFAVVLHKSLIDDGFCFEESVNGYEWIAWLRLAKSGTKILYTTTTTRIYVNDTGGGGESLIRTKNKNFTYYKNSLDGLLIILNEFGEDMKQINKKKYAKYLSWYARSLIATGSIKDGIINTFKSLCYDPFGFRNIKNILMIFTRKSLK